MRITPRAPQMLRGSGPFYSRIERQELKGNKILSSNSCSCLRKNGSVFANSPPYARASGGASADRCASAVGTSTTNAGPLGTNAKLRATLKKPASGSVSKRLERFFLQSVVRSILPDSRTAKCLRIRSVGSDIQVWRSISHATATYGGLQTCGSVWTCPVCNAKISERRRHELLAAMNMHKSQGGSVYLLTLTTPHQRGDDLAQLLKNQQKALESFLRDRQVRAVFSQMGYIGQVRALEVTHGRKSGSNNGWHPHFHILQFCKVSANPVDMKDWQVRLYLRWAVYCEKAGLGIPTYAHGIKLDDGSQAAKYVTKWGLENEMTKGHSKKAKLGGETPFDLLRSAQADNSDIQARALFAEFARCFKGKRQLSWSNGLKSLFNQVEKTDSELASEQDDQAILLGLLNPEQWRDILKLDLRGSILELASVGGWYAVTRLLYLIDGVRSRPLNSHILSEISDLLCSFGISLTFNMSRVVEYRSCVSGEDMPRNALDSEH